MASSINASTTAGLVNTADTSGVLQLQTAGTTAISIDASQAVSFTNSPTVTGGTANGVAYLNGSKVLTTGSALVFDGSNLGIGTTSPDCRVHAQGTTDGIYARLKNTAGTSARIAFESSGIASASIGIPSGTSALAFYLASESTERMRINSAGMLSVNYTSAISGGLFIVSSNGTKGSLIVKNDDSVQLYSLGTGTVTCSGGVLGFTSDERIKIDDGNYSGGLNAVLNITPKYFYYKNSEGKKDETKGRELGFFAQNIQQTCGLEVVHQPEDPDALLGIHDRGVMAVLVSAIQEQQALITQLQADVAALKGA